MQGNISEIVDEIRFSYLLGIIGFVYAVCLLFYNFIFKINSLDAPVLMNPFFFIVFSFGLILMSIFLMYTKEEVEKE